MRVAWYRFTATLGRRRGGYLTIVLLIGLVGGIAMGSVAAARRTQASFATFLASTNPSDLTVQAGAPNLTRELGRLPGVQRVEAADFNVNAYPLGRAGAPAFSAYLPGKAGPVGSINGEYFNQDRVTVTAGRWPTRSALTSSSRPRWRSGCSAGTSARSSRRACTPMRRRASPHSARRE